MMKDNAHYITYIYVEPRAMVWHTVKADEEKYVFMSKTASSNTVHRRFMGSKGLRKCMHRLAIHIVRKVGATMFADYNNGTQNEAILRMSFPIFFF